MDFEYQGLVHRAGPMFEESWWGPGENAIVDFKYSPSERLTWWFDHHQSAFTSAQDEAHFRAGQTGEDGRPGPLAMRQFFDPAYTSCTGWIAHIAAERFGMNVAPLQELVHWANIVDGAKFESAQAAVEMAEPAMKLAMVIESAPDTTDGSISRRFIPLLTEMPLREVLEQPFVQDSLAPLMHRHWEALELIRQRATCDRGVITFDITDQPAEGYNKSIPYYLMPEATYTVGLSRSSFRTKVSVGTNPWTPRRPEVLANIAAICERFGGGGHARVGAISFGVNEAEQARSAVQQIVTELRDLE